MAKKLFIQIPCLNEERTIGDVIQEIPKKELSKLGLVIRVVVIDDNSSDKSSEYAKASGADFILKNKKTLGLAATFKRGLNFCLEKGADIIVNTDGDNQYSQKEIVKIVTPIMRGEADMVIGDRQVEKLTFMPTGKKVGNQVGSFIVRLLTRLSVRDASSGFRAFSRDLALKFNLHSRHTYTHETIIQAAFTNSTVIDVPITFKKRTYGQSRLISSIAGHVGRSTATIIRAILTYKAFSFLVITGGLVISLGGLGVLRFLYFFFSGNGQGHVQSLVISSVLINLGVVTVALGIIADLISVNRKTIEELRRELKK